MELKDIMILEHQTSKITKKQYLKGIFTYEELTTFKSKIDINDLKNLKRLIDKKIELMDIEIQKQNKIKILNSKDRLNNDS